MDPAWGKFIAARKLSTSRIVRKWQHHCDNNELAELSVVRYKSKQFMLWWKP